MQIYGKTFCATAINSFQFIKFLSKYQVQQLLSGMSFILKHIDKTNVGHGKEYF